MALGDLQSVRDVLILARQQQYISHAEFVLLFEYSMSKPLFPSWKFELFDLNPWSDEECRMGLGFAKSKRFLGIPDKITCHQRNICNGMEGLSIFLKRLLIHADILI